MDNEALPNQGIKFTHNDIFRDVESVAEIYVDTITEDIIPFQYNEIAKSLKCALEYVQDNIAHIPENLDDRIKEQIEEISAIPNKLSGPDEALTTQALKEYLTEKFDFYREKDRQIEQLIDAPTPELQGKIISDFIMSQQSEKEHEFRRIITESYDKKNNLIGYNENTASIEAKEAWGKRDINISNQLTQSLETWAGEEQSSYLKALKAYSNPEQAEEIRREQEEQLGAELQSAKESLAKNEKLLRAGKKPESVKDYLLVKENILTKEEAELFNYQELNTYGAYYGSNSKLIEDIFELAKSFYPDDKRKGLEELSNVS